MHITVEPSISYSGTPVVLLSSLNVNGTANIAPMSPVWWLGWCMLGLSAKGHTAGNLQREKECVLNLPSAALIRLLTPAEIPEEAYRPVPHMVR